MKTILKYFVIGAGLMLWFGSAQAMPSYARQTGLDCNSCHIGFNNVPLFTRTGRLFILKGFHQPNSIRGKLRQTGFDAQGNDTPEYGGNYLATNWTDFWSMRFISDFVDGGYTSGVGKNKVTSTPVARTSMFFTGPITDWLGLWTEMAYLGNNAFTAQSGPGAGGPTNLNVFADDEYRLTASKDIGNDSFIAAAFGNEYPDAINEFVFPPSLPKPWGYGQGGVGKEYEIGSYSFYGFWNNALLTQVALVTGDYDNTWSNGHNTYVAVAWDGLPGTGDTYRRESHDMWFVGEAVWGQNSGSMVNPARTSLICTSLGCPPGVNDNNNALSFSNSVGSPAENIADLTQFGSTGIEIPTNSDAWRLSWHDIAADNGNHSWYFAAAISGIHQQFQSGAAAGKQTVGFEGRYYFNRTYGFDLWANKSNGYYFKDVAGVQHDVLTHVNYGLTLLWAPAMNMNIGLSYSPNHSTVINPANYTTGGYTYSLNLDYGL
jgi:hypothetical protein